MAGIKNLEYENGIIEKFSITVNEDLFAGTFDIEKPDGWDSINCVLNLDEEFFNVDDFVLGETQKFKILEYNDKPTFDLLKNVYDQYGGDAKILFSWTAEKNGTTYDILGEGYQLNLNKYQIQYEKEARSIELEVKKRESNNKLLTREDVSVDLFTDKDLDDNTIAALDTIEFYYKERNRTQGNFYFFKLGQFASRTAIKTFFVFTVSNDDREIGDNQNEDAGYFSIGSWRKYLGDFVFTRSEIQNVSVEFSNFDVICEKPFTLYVLIKNGGTIEDKIQIKTSVPYVYNSVSQNRINMLYEVHPIGTLSENRAIELIMKVNDNTSAVFTNLDEQTSIEIKSDIAVPLRKARMLKLADAIERITKLYAGITLNSTILKTGHYSNTAVATGLFLRGFSDLYATKKLKTSLKNILYDGAAPLMALGFDVMDNVLKIESVDWFFKPLMNADFSNKPYIETETTIQHDLKASYNELVFGSKKFSTGNKGDIKNFNTKMEVLTPIESAKNKFDKTTDFIIDDWKIQNMISESSTASISTDDDIAIIDLVNVGNFKDSGILSDCVHMIDGGYLWLICYDTPFDTIPIEVGQNLKITSGLNAGTYEVLTIDKSRIKLNKTTGITEGTGETPIEYIVTDILKNRTKEGFYSLYGVDDIETATNIRHNPKYHLARWFGFFGGAFIKKPTAKTLKVTDYTNNGNVDIERNSTDMRNELHGHVHLEDAETLYRMNLHKMPYFNGELIETVITDVSFFEFMEFYTNWRFSEENKERGFVRINTPVGIKDVYIFGSEALSYDRARMELGIKGKIKNPLHEPYIDPFPEIPEDPENPPIPTELTYFETYRQDTLCNQSRLEFELSGSETVTINWTFTSNPDGGYASVYNKDTNALIKDFSTDGDVQTTTHVLNGTMRFEVRINSAFSYGNEFYSCSAGGTSMHFYASLDFGIAGSKNITAGVVNEGFKYSRNSFDPEPV